MGKFGTSMSQGGGGGGGGTATNGTVAVGTPSDLDTTTPTFTGQLALALSTGTLYISNSTTTGDWTALPGSSGGWGVAGGPLLLYPQAAPGSPSDGMIWQDNGDGKFKVRQDGATKDVVGIQLKPNGGANDRLLAMFDADGDVQPNDSAVTDADVGDAVAVSLEANGIISGCQVSYVTGLTFHGGPGVYRIGGTRYTTGGNDVTLSNADATNPRKDLIVLNDDGTYTAIDGTPDANPAEPSFDETTQLRRSQVDIAALATTPTNVVATDVYQNNAEYTTSSTNSTRINPDQTNNPLQGAKNIKFTAAVANDTLTLDKGSTIDLTSVTMLVGFLKFSANWGTKYINVQLLNATNNTLGNGVVIQGGRLGLNAQNTTTYQQFAITVASFNLKATDAPRKIRMRVVGTGSGTLSADMDAITWQQGLEPTALQNTFQSVETDSGTITAGSPNAKLRILGSQGLSTQATGNIVRVIGSSLAPPVLADYTQINTSGALFYTGDDSTMRVTANAVGGDNFRILARAIPAAHWRVTAKLRIQSNNKAGGGFMLSVGSGFNTAGMLRRDSASGKFVIFASTNDGGDKLAVNRFNDETHYGGSTPYGATAPLYSPVRWFMIENDGTTISYKASKDGVTWDTIYSEAATTFCTENQFGFFAQSNNSDWAVTTIVEYVNMETLP